MAEAKKDTIYIDVDDEITSIIDKVKGSPQKIVALVLPKRCTALQSVVNMKLLKKSAASSKKSIVLITSETSLLPLAGAAGFHVAKNLQTKPEIPVAMEDDTELVDAEDEDTGLSKVALVAGAAAASGAIGKKAGAKAATNIQINGDEDEETPEVELDNATVEPEPDKPKPKKDKKLKIPDFNRFRAFFFLAATAIAILIAFLFWASLVAPKAKITLKTDTSSLDQSMPFTLSATAKEADLDKAILPAVMKEVKKTDTEKAPATGSKDIGTKATGKMTITNCINDGNPKTLPAGTSFSSGSLTFASDEAVTLDPALYSGSTCKSATFGLSKTVGVTAVQPGTQYNLSARTYNIAGQAGDMRASGTDMTGGTTQIAKVVSADDVEAAKQKLAGRSTQAATAELAQQLKDAGLYPVEQSLASSDPKIIASPAVGEAGTDVTVTSETIFDMLGTSQDNIKNLLEASIKKQITSEQQKIQDNGLTIATYKLLEKKAPSEQKLQLDTTAVVGPDINQDEIKNSVTGKKRGDIQQSLGSRSGIKEVTVEFSPFWVSKAPKKASKITLVLVEAGGQNQ